VRYFPKIESHRLRGIRSRTSGAGSINCQANSSACGWRWTSSIWAVEAITGWADKSFILLSSKSWSRLSRVVSDGGQYSHCPCFLTAVSVENLHDIRFHVFGCILITIGLFERRCWSFDAPGIEYFECRWISSPAANYKRRRRIIARWLSTNNITISVLLETSLIYRRHDVSARCQYCFGLLSVLHIQKLVRSSLAGWDQSMPIKYHQYMNITLK